MGESYQKSSEFWGSPRKYVNGQRVCYNCKKEKSLEEFPRDRTKFLGRKYLCKECNSLGRARNGYRGLRWNVFSRDSFTCQYCGAKAPEVQLEVDHILARSLGGSDRMDNLVTACKDCNRGKLAKIGP